MMLFRLLIIFFIAFFTNESSWGAEEIAHELELDITYEEVVSRTGAPGCTWYPRHTHLSDLDDAGKAALLGLKIPAGKKFIEIIPNPEPVRRDDLPEKFDWRDFRGVTPVKSQGSCGSCWAFCAMGAWESQVFIYDGIEYDLSEQQILSCNDNGEGCNGGWMETAYEVFMDPGSVLERDMPYQARDDIPCTQDQHPKVAVLDGWLDLPWDVDRLKEEVLLGPVAVAMTVYGDFFSYGGGCYENSGSSGVNHGVLLFGWDDSMCEGEGAWIVKNSWGSSWGLDGFFYIKYGSCYIGLDGDALLYTPELQGNLFPRKLVIDDTTTGNGNGRPDEGETVQLWGKFINTGLDATGIIAHLETDAAGIDIEVPLAILGELNHLDSLQSNSAPFYFSVADTFSARNVTFRVSFTSDGGYAGDEEFELLIGRPEILLYLDHTTETVRKYYETDIAAAIGRSYEVWNEETDGAIDGEELSLYKTVLWITGEAVDAFAGDTGAVAVFLDSGGGLFLAGQNIGEEIGETNFYREYLKSIHLADDTDDYIILGIDGDLIGEGIIVATSGGGGANNCSSPSAIAPTEGAITSFEFGNVKTGAAIRYEGVYRLVYFSTSFEAINNTGERRMLLGRIMDFLGSPSGRDSSDGTAPSISSAILLNATPNPFNPICRIEYTIPPGAGSIPVTLKIYDISGRVICLLFEGESESGTFTLTWDGTTVNRGSAASGVYVCRLTAGSHVETERLVLLK